MATEQDNVSLENFSIQNTMEMGLGNASLIEGLLDSGSATGNPDDLTKIVKTVEDIPPTEQPLKGKEIPNKIEGKTPTGEQLANSFLGTYDEEEEEEEEDNTSKATNKVTKIVKNSTETLEDDAEENNGDDEESRFGALSNDLFKLGVFTSEEEGEEPTIKTPEEFLERFKAEKQKGAIEIVNNFIGQFGEDYQEAFDAIFVKGVNPKDYYKTYNNIENFAELDLTSETNQESIVRQGLLDQGFDPEDIETEIERYKNYGDLETVAAKHHKVLVKKEALKLQDLEAKAERDLQQKAATRNQYIQNVQAILNEKLKTKEFDGIPLNPKLAGELQDFLLVEKYKTSTGETLTDFDKTILEMKRPENHATKVKMALLLKLLEKDPTLSTIQRTGITKTSNKLFESVARQTVKEGVKSTQTAQPKSWFS